MTWSSQSGNLLASLGYIACMPVMPPIYVRISMVKFKTSLVQWDYINANDQLMVHKIYERGLMNCLNNNDNVIIVYFSGKWNSRKEWCFICT